MNMLVHNRCFASLLIGFLGLNGAVAHSTFGCIVEEFTYRLNAPKGAKYRFKITSTMTQDGKQSSGMDAIVVQEITEVRGNKTTITSYYEMFATPGTELPEMVANLILGMRVVMVVDELGRTVETKVTGAGMMGDVLGKQIILALPFPDGVIKRGDTWEQEATVFGMKSKTKVTFVGFDRYKDKMAALIQLESKSAQGVESADYKMWIEPSSGVMLKIEGKTVTSRPKGTTVMVFERLD